MLVSVIYKFYILVFTLWIAESMFFCKEEHDNAKIDKESAFYDALLFLASFYSHILMFFRKNS